MQQKILYLIIILLVIIAQNSIPQKIAKAKIIEGDTLIMIELPSVPVFANPRTAKRYWNKHTRLVRYVKKMYPIAKTAKEKYYEVTKHLSDFEKKSQQRKYIRSVSKEIKNKYEEEIRNMTITQGKILLKLMHREIGITSYDILEELKGSFSAIMWQSIARIFGTNLKATYNPAKNKEDAMIEYVVQAIEQGKL